MSSLLQAALRRRRRGYLFVAVLLSALIVSAMGAAAISVSMTRMQSVTDTTDWTMAEALANAAVEEGVLRVQEDDNWRTTFVNKALNPSNPVALDSGSYNWLLLDEDNNLADDDSDFVRVVGIGRFGNAVVATGVQLMPTGSAMDCTGVALSSNSSINLATLIKFHSDQIIASNGDVSATNLLSELDADAEAAGNCSGSITGQTISSATPRRHPGSSVFDYYLANGTWIEMSRLPLASGFRTIKSLVISPQVNPFGPAGNVEGIYVLDCQSQDIRIKNCRIVGTLVLRNPGSNSVIDGSVNWQPAVSNYPALLTNGSLILKTTTTALSESTIGVNLNILGAPVAVVVDTDTNDSYPSEINGLCYIAGTLDLASDLTESQLRGSTICGAIKANSDCRFLYRDLFQQAPPPGFASGNPMVIAPGTHRRESL